MNQASFTTCTLLKVAVRGCFVLLVVLAVSTSAIAAKPKLPNIVLIYADDLGYGDIGCYNSESKVPTRNIDRLASEGMRFTDAHSPSTVCTPSRYGVLTGRSPFRLNYKGVFVGVGGPCLINPGRLTLASMLKAKGYATAMTGKWHVGLSFFDKEGKPISDRRGINGNERVRLTDFSRPIPDGPLAHGFDRFFGTACCPTTDWLYAWIDGDKIPVPPTEVRPESVVTPATPYNRDCRPGLTAPDFKFREVDLVFLEKSKAFLKEHVESKPEQPFFLFHSTQAVHLPSLPAPQFQGKTNAGPHGDFIFELDWVVGQLMETLDQLHVADNTLVILTSDNGPEVPTVIAMRADHQHDGARPWRGMKRDQWEGGHRVPFIVRCPGHVKPDSECSETICQTDIFETLAQIVHYQVPDDAAEDSFSLLPLLKGKQPSNPIRPYTLHTTINLSMAIREGNWKYLDHRGSGGNNYNNPGLAPYRIEDTAPDAPGQLYDLATDPGEKNNLYDKRPELVKKLKAQLQQTIENGRSRP